MRDGRRHVTRPDEREARRSYALREAPWPYLLCDLCGLCDLCVNAAEPATRKIRHGRQGVAPVGWACACCTQGRINAEIAEAPRVKRPGAGSEIAEKTSNWRCARPSRGTVIEVDTTAPGVHMRHRANRRRGLTSMRSNALKPTRTTNSKDSRTFRTDTQGAPTRQGTGGSSRGPPGAVTPASRACCIGSTKRRWMAPKPIKARPSPRKDSTRHSPRTPHPDPPPQGGREKLSGTGLSWSGRTGPWVGRGEVPARRRAADRRGWSRQPRWCRGSAGPGSATAP